MTAATRGLVVLLAVTLAAHPAAADRMVLHPGVPDRTGFAQVVYRFDRPLGARGTLRLTWTDQLGRLVARQHQRVGPATGRTVAFRLDMRRAVAMGNTLHARLVSSAPGSGAVSAAVLRFVARPPADPWNDLQVIAYQPQDQVRLAALARIGITAGRVLANRDDAVRPPVAASVAPFVASDLRFYVENIATDFYAAYHRWVIDRPVNAAFQDVQARHRQDPADLSVFIRHPGLSDPAWLARIHDRLVRTVRDHAPYRPLYYDLADEPGIGDLAAAWDFDLSPASLAGMRRWLHDRYGALAALNRQWGSRFAHWNEVVPMTTDQAMQRQDDNLSAWADFKEWMDVAFARALRVGTDAVHAGDPQALAAIEGAQVPGWGGYDYTSLPRSVDAMEIYDAGANVDIARSLDPGLVMLTTSTGGDPTSVHAVWRALLRGARGVILWDENGGLAGDDGSLGPWGRQAAPLFAELEHGLGALLIDARPTGGAIATLYAPASFRVQWLLDRRPDGAAWARRDAEAESGDNTARAAMGSFTRTIRHSGLQQRFLSPDLIERGALRGVRVLILAHAIALSTRTSDAIRRFVAHGGTVIADVVPGEFDQHGRRLPHPALADLFAAPAMPGRGTAILALPDRLIARLAAAGVQPDLRLTTPDGNPASDVEIYRSIFGTTTILALQRDVRSGPSDPEPLTLTFPRPVDAMDLAFHRALGVSNRLSIALDPIRPTLLALPATPPASPRLAVPAHAEAGRDIDAAVSVRDASLLTLEVFDPAGRALRHYGGRRLSAAGRTTWRIPLALNDPAGPWEIKVTDAVSGRRTTARVDVAAPGRDAPAQH